MTSRSQLSVIISSQESPKNLSHGVNAAEDEVDVYTKVRSPEESEKRVGAIFDDLDLGLDPTVEFNDNDQVVRASRVSNLSPFAIGTKRLMKSLQEVQKVFKAFLTRSGSSVLSLLCWRPVAALTNLVL
ncbi:hypothetical protein M378DRAFT_852701 [Amanita muscaria Koide BX008]|uniref:Uncharacterized protein n=1 Tax=Amanita muscaria (strain Koide BX008) TaxID=946122 RepID=A0A0C2WCG6_AMAMK|nr:hypothetical protein M378DRAFT_852701 [Amanita muscaria Koide BX008]